MHFNILKSGPNQTYNFFLDNFNLQAPKWVSLIEKMTPIIYSRTNFNPLSIILKIGVQENPTCQLLFFFTPHPSLYILRGLHMNIQVPSILPSILPGYCLVSLKIHRILSIFGADVVYLFVCSYIYYICV